MILAQAADLRLVALVEEHLMDTRTTMTTTKRRDRTLRRSLLVVANAGTSYNTIAHRSKL